MHEKNRILEKLDQLETRIIHIEVTFTFNSLSFESILDTYE